MGKRYHCEYCNRSFADTLHTRKNHINGVQHKRNRKLHYDSFKDPAVLLAEETSKPPCRKFFATGTCGFGANCWYSHTSPQMLLATQEASLGRKTPDQSQAGQPQATLKEWLEKYDKKRKKVECKDAPGKSASQSSYTLPPGLPPLQQLPPSLLPPPPGGYPELPREEWG
ncbi:zinc finger matrin-type protein 5 [Pocillopora verrucosa]|uniref:zinc finger matrin-type protein 5 n=1 Tax=Pocillopora verrucosa TaxID=203993 RepID=UPI002797460E|nr:zinc finger matrin-type protein 5-like [Pocillopora verrucosa]